MAKLLDFARIFLANPVSRLLVEALQREECNSISLASIVNARYTGCLRTSERQMQRSR